MKKQLMKWLKNIVVISSILLLFYQWSVADEQSAEDTAKTQYEQFKTRAGKSDTLRKNFINPLLGGGNLKTIDLSQEGQAQIACPSSKEFLTVMIRPKATGDFDADIYWDSNFDNRMDKSITVNGISGVCTDGFIVCAPGTWQSCTPYKITFDKSNSNLLTEPAAMYDLSGCFCVNNSCGGSLVWQNLSYIVKTFGGAIAGAFQQADSRYAISEARIDGPAIYFYGQQASNCSIVQTQGGSATPEQYYNPRNATLLTQAVESETVSQQGNPDSFYTLMARANEAQQTILNNCVIQRNVYENRLDLYDIIAPVSGNGGTVRPCGDKCIQVVLGWEGDNYWCGCCNIYELYYDLMVKRPDLIESATLVYAAWDDWIQFWFNNYLIWNGPYGNWTSPTGYPPGNCELGTSWRRGLNVDATQFFSGIPVNSIVRTKTRVAVCGCGEGFGLLNIQAKNFCEKQENISDTCQQYVGDPACTLKDEIVDGVYTVRNGIRTGLTPVSSCRNYCGEPYCPPYWKKERIYTCTTNPADLSYAKRRLASIVPSSQYDNSKIKFTDVRYENNTWASYPNQQFLINKGQSGEDCEKACKVRISKKNTQIGGTTQPVSTMHFSGSGDYIYYYRACYNDQCPVDAGEELVTPCQCMQDFAGAATVMQFLRMAGQDIICSSGNIKALPGY